MNIHVFEPEVVTTHPAGKLQEPYARLRAGFEAEPYPDLETRRSRLSQLARLLREHGVEIERAVSGDFGNRSRHETRLLELFPTLEEIRHAQKHLRRWMRVERRSTGRWFHPARSYLVPQPLGVVGIVAPWNYPIFLAAGPLVCALAAGNRALVKMSEFTPRTGVLFESLVAQTFPPEVVSVVNGDAQVGQQFSALPFDHLLFTGSTAVGHHVMRAAADNLTPVTLELGGKSPAIVAPDFPLARAADRIAVGKTLNAGQTCIAPDYVLVPRGQERAFVAQLQKTIDAIYPDLANTPDYTHIINARHFQRLQDYVNEARAGGCEVLPLSSRMREPDISTRRFPPQALINPGTQLAVMRDEIFGPLLPVIGYESLTQALAFVTARPRPLAFYYFDADRARIQQVLRTSHAGGVTINDTILHIAQDDLPFGGVGHSGMGAYHGKAGFATFSSLKPVFHQSRFNTIGLFKPPYGRLFEQMVSMIMR